MGDFIIEIPLNSDNDFYFLRDLFLKLYPATVVRIYNIINKKLL